jgi:hypothetical protein
MTSGVHAMLSLSPRLDDLKSTPFTWAWNIPARCEEHGPFQTTEGPATMMVVANTSEG